MAAETWQRDRAKRVNAWYGLIRMTVLIMTLALVSGASTASASDGFTTEDVSFHGAGGIELNGTVVAPSVEVDVRDLPAMVLVHGSGPGEREQLMPLAEEFALRGIVTLVYDKRTEGYSLFERDYSMLADDALAAVELLGEREDVDQERVGVWGLSEGGWVAPLAASRSADVDYLITVAANGGPPAEQEQWSQATNLDRHGVRGSLHRTYSQTWLRQGIGMGLFAEPFHDPVPVLREISQPVLAMWGEYDRLTPPGESLATFRDIFESIDHPSYRLLIIPEAEHALYQTPDEGFTRGDEFAPGYVETVASWVDDLESSLPGSAVDPAPEQERATITMEPLSWHESPWLQLAAAVLFAVAFAGYPIVAAARRFAGWRTESPVRPGRWLAAAGLLAFLGLFIYFIFLMVTAAQSLGPIVAGRPVPWLVMQAIALVTVVALVGTATSWWRVRSSIATGEHVRLTLLVVAGVAFVPWALYWGLLLP